MDSKCAHGITKMVKYSVVISLCLVFSYPTASPILGADVGVDK